MIIVNEAEKDVDKRFSNTHQIGQLEPFEYLYRGEKYSLNFPLLSQEEFDNIFLKKSETDLKKWAERIYSHAWGLNLKTFKIRWFKEDTGGLDTHVQYPVKQSKTFAILDVDVYQRLGPKFIGEIKEFRLSDKLFELLIQYPRMLETYLVYFLNLRMFKEVTGEKFGYLDRQPLIELLRLEVISPTTFNVALYKEDELINQSILPEKLEQILLHGPISNRPIKVRKKSNQDGDSLRQKAIAKPSKENLTNYVNYLAELDWGRHVNIPIFIVSPDSLEGNAASFNISPTNGFISLSFNMEYIISARNQPKLFEETTKHEIAHYMTYFRNGVFGFNDGNLIFEEELKRIGALSNYDKLSDVAARLNLPFSKEDNVIEVELSSLKYIWNMLIVKLKFEETKEFDKRHKYVEEFEWIAK